MLSLHYHGLIGKIKEYEGKKYLMVDDYMLDKALDKIKEIIGLEKFYDTKILIDTGDKLPKVITLKNIVILMTCVIKDDFLNKKLYPQIYLEEALCDKQT